MTVYRQDDYSLRAFREEDWELCRDIRLESLKAYPDMLAQPYESACATTEAEWKAILNSENRTRFGLFHKDDVVGLFCMHRNPDDLLECAPCEVYIRREHQWKNLASLFVQAGTDWVKEKGCTKVSVQHKDGNLASMRLIKKLGFEYSHMTDAQSYPDGSVAGSHAYHFKLGL